jgi:hypothetical protein
MIPSTKFGYGTDRLVFSPWNNFNVRLQCQPNGLFYLEEVYLLSRLGPDAATALVKILDEWAKEWLADRGGVGC